MWEKIVLLTLLKLVVVVWTASTVEVLIEACPDCDLVIVPAFFLYVYGMFRWWRRRIMRDRGRARFVPYIHMTTFFLSLILAVVPHKPLSPWIVLAPHIVGALIVIGMAAEAYSNVELY